MSSRSRVQTWDALGFHMRELAENLDFRGFQALSPGLGLGELKAVDKPNFVSRDPAGALLEGPATGASPHRASPMMTSGIPAVSPGDISNPRSEGVSAQAPTNQVSKRPPAGGGRVGKSPRGVLRFMRLAYAWSIDLSLVVICLGIALVCAAAALSVGEGKEDFWFDGGPIAWMLSFEIWEACGIVGAVFLMYLAVFKLLAGRTFGESLAGSKREVLSVAESKSDRKGNMAPKVGNNSPWEAKSA